MSKNARLGPPYSMFFISDISLDGEIEASGRHIEWSDTYVTITCVYCYDSDTSVTLGPFNEVAQHGAPVFDGEIKTPNREVAVSTAHLDIVLSQKVPSSLTRIRIWENDPTEPDDIVIALG